MQDAGEAVIAFLENTVFAQAVPPEEVAAIHVEPIQGEGVISCRPTAFCRTYAGSATGTVSR
jgi:4-aminobutyrate aminotransferase-like enzyme